MDNISKVRTLLHIAREALAYHINEAEQRHEKERLIRPDRDIVARIDAALAEPVDDVDAELRLHKEDRLRLRVENLRLKDERDKARAAAAALYAAAEDYYNNCTCTRAEMDEVNRDTYAAMRQYEKASGK